MTRVYLTLILVLLFSACATRYVRVSHQRLGPHADVEVWRDRQTGQCERRTTLGDYMTAEPVACPR